MGITIYSKNNCPSCVQAKALLKTHNYDYEEAVLGVDIEVDVFKEMYPEAKTVPQIIIDGVNIGGYEKLVEWFNKQQLPRKKEDLRNLLKKSVMTITFTKKDGSERVMRCTLQSDLIPEYVKVTEREKTENADNLPVYDIEVKGWRSINVSTISNVSL